MVNYGREMKACREYMCGMNRTMMREIISYLNEDFQEEKKCPTQEKKLLTYVK